MTYLQARTANLLPAPDGTGNSVADLQRLLREWVPLSNAVGGGVLRRRMMMWERISKRPPEMTMMRRKPMMKGPVA